VRWHHVADDERLTQFLLALSYWPLLLLVLPDRIVTLRRRRARGARPNKGAGEVRNRRTVAR
jgi:hypothetical protein